MRRFLAVLFILVVALMVYPFLFVDDSTKSKLTGLPWQIEECEKPFEN